MPKFPIIDEGDGFYTIKNVPIFEEHTNRGFNCDDSWMTDAVKNYRKLAEQGHRPVVILGHNVKGKEKEAVGFLDDLKLKGKRLYANLIRIPKEIKEKIVKNAYPSRSVEVLPKSRRILALALLGGTAPHFPLPQMMYDNNNNNEPSIWFRSTTMDVFTDEQRAALQDIVKDAVAESIETYSMPSVGMDEGGSGVVELSYQDAADLLNSSEPPEIYEGEDGRFYSIDEEGTYYGWPQKAGEWISRIAGKGVGVADNGLQSIGRNMIKGHYVARRKINRALWKAAPIGGKIRSTLARARNTALMDRQRWLANKKLLRGLGGTALGSTALSGITFTAGTALRNRKHKKAGYSIDEETGILYYDGVPVGEIEVYEDAQAPVPAAVQTGQTVPTVPANPAALPTVKPVTVTPTVSATDVGPSTGDNSALQTPVSQPTTDLIEPLDREDSDQFAFDDEIENNEFYDLQREVAQLKVANALLTEGRKAEYYEKYLQDLQQKGVPVGDIESTVKFLMTQTPEQVEEFKQILESQPRVQLGRMDDNIQKFDLNTYDEIIQDYEVHKDDYEALGVKPDDLKWARFVRSRA